MKLGLDVGGTKIDAVALGAGDQVLARVRIPTGFGPEAVLRSAHAAVTQVTDAAGTGSGALASIGIGIPGMVDAAAGIVRHAVNLGLDELELGPALSARLGVPVSVENDVNAASLGAYHLLGLDRSAGYLNLGTGLAAGFVLDGALWRGAHGTAGEIGHIPVRSDGELCACGQRGCLETVASGGWLARRWETSAALPALDLFDQADAGDVRAVTVRDDLVGGVAAAVRLLVLTVDVDTVVIGGGLSNLGTRLLERLFIALEQQARGSEFLASLDLAARVRLVPAGQPIAAIGAALAGTPLPGTPLPGTPLPAAALPATLSA